MNVQDPQKVRAVLIDLLHKSLVHYNHGALLCQDVNVARVTSWVHAESFKGTPGIFDDNDAELTKKLKETITQSDQLLKLGLAGPSRQGGGGGGGHKGSQGSGKGGKGKKGGKKGEEVKHCFHCRQKVNILPVFFPQESSSIFFSGTHAPSMPLMAWEWWWKGWTRQEVRPGSWQERLSITTLYNFIPHILFLI